MSWSIAAIGRAGAVRAAVKKQFDTSSKCIKPEETVRLAAAALIDVTLDAQNSMEAVKITASGSQSFKDYANKTGVQNHLTITIEPIFNFIE